MPRYFLSDGELTLEQWMTDDHPEFHRTEQPLTDLRYLLSVPPTGPLSDTMIQNLQQGIHSFMKVLLCIQAKQVSPVSVSFSLIHTMSSGLAGIVK